MIVDKEKYVLIKIKIVKKFGTDDSISSSETKTPNKILRKSIKITLLEYDQILLMHAHKLAKLLGNVRNLLVISCSITIFFVPKMRTVQKNMQNLK